VDLKIEEQRKFVGMVGCQCSGKGEKKQIAALSAISVLDAEQLTGMKQQRVAIDRPESIHRDRG
jgi:hypothetical protein